MTKLDLALLAFQKDAPQLHKDAENPHFKNRYLSLDGLLAAIRPKLNEHGLIVTQSATFFETFPALRTRIVHAESGEALEDIMPLAAAQQNPQAQGSAITYARRYSLMAMLGLVADEDDDGNASSAAQSNGAATQEPRTSGEWKWPMGKHSGQTLADTPGGYMDWYLENGRDESIKQRIHEYRADLELPF